MSFRATIETHLQNFKAKKDSYRGFIDGVEGYDEFQNALKSTGFRFVIRNTVTKTKKGFFFQSIHNGATRIPFFGPLFSIKKSTLYECCQGKSRCHEKKTEIAEHELLPAKKTRVRKQPSRKIGCLAKMHITQITIYHDYKIETYNSTGSEKQTQTVKKLKARLSSSEASKLSTTERFLFLISSEVVHCHPPATPKKYKFDQDVLEQSINAWASSSQEDSFFFRPYCENTKDTPSTLLFCHQSAWQKDLIELYGNNICLLDKPTIYRTYKYSLPLYFLAVWKHVIGSKIRSFEVVGTFVILSESTPLIQEALSVFTRWNPEWKPRYFLTELSAIEIEAVEGTFPSSTVYLCPFRREQTWYNWLNRKDNILPASEAALKKAWRTIAASKTETEFLDNIETMKESECYEMNPRAQTYVEQVWLPVAHRWVYAYYEKEFLAMLVSISSLESYYRLFKNTYIKLRQNSGKSLTDLVREVIEEYLPSIHSNSTNVLNKSNDTSTNLVEQDVTYLELETAVDSAINDGVFIGVEYPSEVECFTNVDCNGGDADTRDLDEFRVHLDNLHELSFSMKDVEKIREFNTILDAMSKAIVTRIELPVQQTSELVETCEQSAQISPQCLSQVPDDYEPVSNDGELACDNRRKRRGDVVGYY